jgi:hypothetical protein
VEGSHLAAEAEETRWVAVAEGIRLGAAVVGSSPEEGVVDPSCDLSCHRA